MSIYKKIYRLIELRKNFYTKSISDIDFTDTDGEIVFIPYETLLIYRYAANRANDLLLQISSKTELKVVSLKDKYNYDFVSKKLLIHRKELVVKKQKKINKLLKKIYLLKQKQ